MYAVGIRVVGLVACVILFLCRANGQAVSADSLGQASILPPVEINSSWLHSYGVGGHAEVIDSLELVQQQTSSLGQLLQQAQAIYLKEYGPGMLSSISLRGTSASQTALLWNGLPVNFPSLGQADFSLIPAYFVDDAEVFYGGVSPLAGAGAIGGAVAINDLPPIAQQTLNITQELASFGTFFSGIKAGFSGKRAGVSLAAFHRQSANDFTFKNLSKAGQPIERQAHGAFSGDGWKSGAFWKPWKKGRFDFHGWFTQFEREIIPPYTIPDGIDIQDDHSLRLSLGYQHQFQSFLKWDSRVGRIEDFIQFNGLASSTTQYMWMNSIEWMPAPSLQVRVGALVNNIKADVPAYGSNLSEWRSEIYLMANWFITPNWVLNANTRQGTVAGSLNPLSPSLGSELSLMKNSKASLIWSAQFSRSFRVPTLNDRYWSPGGNLMLQPEQGWNASSGLSYSAAFGHHVISTSLTGFGHWINDWILWLPQTEGYWSPVNVRNVHSRGVEFSAKHSVKVGEWTFSDRFDYKLTVARVEQGYSGDDAYIGNQLPFVPSHQAGLNLNAAMMKWHVNSSVAVTGSRFTLVDNDVLLDPYATWDAEVGRQFNLKQSLFAASFKVSNLLNTRYENLPFRPMPGRSYSFRLNYALNKNRE